MIDVLVLLLVLLFAGSVFASFRAFRLRPPAITSADPQVAKLQSSANSMARTLEQLKTREETGDVYLPDSVKRDIESSLRHHYGE